MAHPAAVLRRCIWLETCEAADAAQGKTELQNVAFPQRIVIVDDDKDFADFLSEYLRGKGSHVTTFSAAEQLLGLKFDFDFYLVDLMLPGVDGIDLIGFIRAKTAAGIVIISGRMGPDAFNAGLSAGADMYLNKPVRFDQVVHAINTVNNRLVRGGNARKPSWSLQTAENTLRDGNGVLIPLSPVEAKLIRGIASAGAAGIGRRELALLAGIEHDEERRNLDAAVFRLRKKIERATSEPAPLRTLHGVGYAVQGAIIIE